MDYAQFLGPTGLAVFLIAAITAIWKAYSMAMTNMRRDLDKCTTQHDEANRTLQSLSVEMGMMKGKLEVLEAHSINKFIPDIITAVREGVKSSG